MFFHNRFCCVFQVSGAGIVSESLPKFHHAVVIHLCKIVHRRQFRYKTLIIRDNSHNPGLLQHNLAEPDPVGIFCSAPGKVPLSALIPIKQLFCPIHAVSISQNPKRKKIPFGILSHI